MVTITNTTIIFAFTEKICGLEVFTVSVTSFSSHVWILKSKRKCAKFEIVLWLVKIIFLRNEMLIT